MRKADIYLNGQIINTVEFDVIKTELYKDIIALTVSVGDSSFKVVALVPTNHLIIIKN